MPLKSGRPSAVLGAGAFKLGLPSGRRGMPGVGWFNHCAAGAAAMATTATMQVRTSRCDMKPLFLCRDRQGANQIPGSLRHRTRAVDVGGPDARRGLAELIREQFERVEI